MHTHHLAGPFPTVDPTYQFRLIGNAIDGGTAAHQFKWGLAIHNSHHGLIQGNVIYNYGGAGIMFEDGSESYNVLEARHGGPGDALVNLARGPWTFRTDFGGRSPSSNLRAVLAFRSRPAAPTGSRHPRRIVGNLTKRADEPRSELERTVRQTSAASEGDVAAWGKW